MWVYPWSLDNLEKKAAKNGYVKGTIAYDHFVQTNHAKAYNSFKVPAISGYVILTCFACLCLTMGCIRLINYFVRKERIGVPTKKTKIDKVIQKTILKKPILGNKYAQEYGKGLFTIRAPLRMQTIILILFFLANILPLTTFYQILDPARNTSWPKNRFAAQVRYFADRAGVLAISQLPILFALSGRNSPVAFLTGCSFTTSMFFHRWIGRWIALLAFFHGVGYTAYLFNQKTYASYWYKYKFFPFGPVALIVIIFTVFTAHRPILRKYAYDIFVVLHVCLVIVFVALLHLHIHLMDSPTLRAFVNFVYISIAFWVFDRVVRVLRLILFNLDIRFKTRQRWSCGKIERLQGINVLRITVNVPSSSSAMLTSLTYAGSHFYLYIPRIRPLSSHPFSLVQSRMLQDEKGIKKTQLTFCASVHNGITKTLSDKWQDKDLPIFLDGPYGVKHDLISFDDIFLFAAGIGITHVLSLLDGIDQVHATRKKNVHLVWCIRSVKMMTIAFDLLEDIKGRMKKEEVLQNITVSVFISDRSSVVEMLPAMDVEKATPPVDEKAVILNSPMEEMTSSESVLPSNDAIILEHSKVNFNYEKSVPEGDFATRLHSIIQSHTTDRFQFTINHNRANMKQIIIEQVNAQSAVFACGSATFLDEIRSACLTVDANYFEEPFDW